MPKLKPDKLRFGTAGIPHSTEPRNTINGIKRVRELGLDAMELEFVRSVNITPQKAPMVKKVAEDNDIRLSCHGQYYINLASKEPEKQLASIARVVNAAVRAHQCGAWTMTFHAGFYMSRPKEIVAPIIHDAFKDALKVLEENKIDIWVRPEVSGKISQWGDVDELIGVSKKFDSVLPCIDFSHLYARTFGKANGYDYFRSVLAKLEQELGRHVLDNMHMHAQGIEFNNGGEKQHLMLKDSDFDYRGLLKALKEFKVKGSLISESPIPQDDALLLQKTFNEL
jgi:deoxyribonuclease IV